MDADLERIRSEIRRKKKPVKKEKSPFWTHYILKTLFVIVLTLITLILLKQNEAIKTDFYKYVYNTNFSFTSVNNLYQKYMGSPLPFKDFFEEKTQPVFNEKLEYQDINLYKDGAELKVNTGYMVPALESGLVVFIGDKDEYKNTVIVQQINGIDVWYSNVAVSNLKLYDYIEKGSLLGEVKSNSLYMVFKKDGKVLNYKDYLK